MKNFNDDFFFDRFNLNNKAWQPNIDVYETVNNLVVKIAVCGLDPNKIELTLSDDDLFLNVKGYRIEENFEEKTKFHQMEIYYGPFERDIDLPNDVSIDRENICAQYQNGILQVVLGKSQKNKPISIKIED